MDNPALAKLSADQLAALSDELKAAYCMLNPLDQDFFASSFKPDGLVTALVRKAEIIKQKQSDRQRMQELSESMKKASKAAATSSDGDAGQILGAAAGVLGLGAVAAVATDSTAFYLGVHPTDLIPALNTEFQTNLTTISTTGRPEALTSTIYLYSGGGAVPGLTINLTDKNEGTEVKVNDLSTRSILEMIRSGGGKLIGLADSLRHFQVGDPVGGADQALRSGTDLADTVGNLRLKERAWKAIKSTAESIEASVRARLEEERQARLALESAWDRYANCPACGVAFGGDDISCRVCGSARPEKPLKADPRMP